MTRITGTTFAVGKRALVNRLTTRLSGVSGMESIGVHYAYPTKKIETEAIWLDDDGSVDQTWRWMQGGTKPVRETWQTDLFIQLQRNRGDITDGQNPSEQAELRLIEIYKQIQQAIAEDPQLDDSQLWSELEAGDISVDRSAPAVRALMRVTFRGHAELYPDP